jgi:hypothetical protein
VRNLFLSAQAGAAKAEVYLERVLAIAREQQKVLGAARSDEHGAAVVQQGQTGRGPRSARAVMAGSPKGFGTLDLKEAKTLLDALAL